MSDVDAMIRKECIDFLVECGYVRADAEQLPTSMLLDMVAYIKE